MIIESMAMAGAEPTFCMGDDTPLPVLSSKPHQLSDYFKQRFAQVSPRTCLGCDASECKCEWSRCVDVQRLLTLGYPLTCLKEGGLTCACR